MKAVKTEKEQTLELPESERIKFSALLGILEKVISKDFSFVVEIFRVTQNYSRKLGF